MSGARRPGATQQKDTPAVKQGSTNTRRAQGAVRTRSARYQAFFENLREAVSVYEAVEDAEGRITGWIVREANEVYLRSVGVARERLIGRLASDAFGPALAEEYARQWSTVLSTGEPLSYERTIGGRHFLISAFPIDAKTIAATGFDITERTDREERIAQLSSLYAVLSRVNEAIVRASDELSLYADVCRIVASDGKFPLVWIGLTDGLTVRPVASSGTAAEYLDTLRVEVSGDLGNGPTGTCIREGRPVVNADFVTNAAMAPWKDAALRHGLRSSASFPLRRDGSMIGALTLYGKEPSSFDAERVQLLEGLGADVSYALDAMQRARALRESEQWLREADRRKNEFLATLAHELRNPLAPIRLALALLNDVTLPPHIRARDTIGRQVTHLVRLVDDLLDVSRITRDKVQLRVEPVTLRAVVQAAVETAAPLLGAADQALVVAEPIPRAWLHADAERLIQVFSNLLNNASKYSARGTTIRVWTDTDGTRVRFGVRDEGRGIAPEHMARLFDMFYQVDGGRQAEGGLGIGLTLVKLLVGLHSGTVEARSDGLGKGSEFVVSLPIGAPPVAETAPEGGGAQAHPGSARVLVVDDNVDAAEMLTLVVEELGHTVRTAHDGHTALSAFRQFRPRVALLDIGLPGADGYELARAFRRSDRGVFLVAITGWGQEEDRRRARDAGFDCHLVKPADPGIVERVLCAAARGERCSACADCLAAEAEHAGSN
jgi:signal transduction histidine kinase/ActR/RegA family two-component response regulator